MTQGIPCELITWNDFDRLSRRLAFQIRESDFQPDMIVAIGRGGYMPARLLSDFLGLMDLASMRIVHYRGSHKEAEARVQYPLNADLNKRRVLLVDDVSDSGDTFALAMEHLLTRGKPAQVRTAALHHKTVARFVPDFFAKKIIRWRWLIYPWALTEDIGAFIAAMDPPPRTRAAVTRGLERDHGIRLSPHQLDDVLAMLGQQALQPD